MNDADSPFPSDTEDKAAREHELQTYLRQDLVEIASEYGRIYSRAAEDPGTAGDQGEENWASLLARWLPDSYKVVTKGRILGVDGTASPQIDLLVLQPSYPSRLLGKKLYLVSGVAAAFECKTTLKAAHLREAARTAKTIRALTKPRTGSPYRELYTPPLYGVLAHSHAWKGAASTPRENVDALLEEGHLAAAHPRDLLNLVCVADLATWDLSLMPYTGRIYFGESWPKYRDLYGLPDEGGPQSTYHRWHEESAQPEPNPVAVLVASLLQHLAREDGALRPLADYFRLAGVSGPSQGSLRPWPLPDVYGPEVAARLQAGAAINGGLWDEWAMSLP